MTVPKRLHHIWVGPREVPDQWASAWQEMHPDWEYKLWREEDIRALPLRCRKQYNALLEAESWHGAADIARLEVLRVMGGVYVDIDSRPLRPLDGAPFLGASVFAGYEPVPSLPGRVANGTIGAEERAPAIETNLDLIQRMTVLDPPWDTTGATSLTAALLVHRRCCNVQVLPARTFYPKTAAGRAVAGKEQPYCEHFWATTNATYPARTVVLVPRRGDGAERDAIWSRVERWWRSAGFDVFVGEDEGPERFNAGRARNRAAEAAGGWDVGIFADADTIPADIESIRKAVVLAERSPRFVRPFKTYRQLSPEATRDFLDDGRLRNNGRTIPSSDVHGGVAVVSRGLFDAVQGYDERFIGWGWEDTAFEASCRVMGSFSQVDGTVYHLHHPISSDRSTSDPQFRANRALGQRYLAATNKRSMAALISERGGGAPLRDGPRIALVVVSNGRGAELKATMEAIRKRVKPMPDLTLICDDSGDAGYADELRSRYPWAEVDAHRHVGHGPAVNRAWRLASELDADYILWMEEDMVWAQDVDLLDVIRVMERGKVAQMAFLRNSHFPAEVEAGPTQLSRFSPDVFTPESSEGHPWLRHRQFYTLNPHIVSRQFLRTNRWPPVPNSEHRFSLRFFRKPDVSVGVWGRLDDDPAVIHAPGERVGTGY